MNIGHEAAGKSHPVVPITNGGRPPAGEGGVSMGNVGGEMIATPEG